MVLAVVLVVVLVLSAAYLLNQFWSGELLGDE